MKTLSLREDIFNYVKRKFGSDTEYPWMRFPDYAVFRHKDNRKLYGIIGGVSRKNRVSKVMALRM